MWTVDSGKGVFAASPRPLEGDFRKIMPTQERIKVLQVGSGQFHATVAEFFAGIGLVRAALEPLGFAVVFANDIEPKKHRLYRLHFGDCPEFRVGDIHLIGAADVPDVDAVTASFPCTDLSLAGKRKGLAGEQSGAFHELTRIIEEMGQRRPLIVLLENVLGFATSHGGQDLRAVLLRLNGLGYECDLFILDARWFVPQSRPRMFVVGRRMFERAPRLIPFGNIVTPHKIIIYHS